MTLLFTPSGMRSTRLTVFTVLALIAGAAAPGTARAQLGFTELALADTMFNTGPNADFWIASAAPADVDADGDLDLLVAGYYVVYNESVEDRLTLYRNDGPASVGSWAFTPVPVDAAGLSFITGDIAWGDYDNDGDPDAVVAGRFSTTTLYRNDAGALVRTSTLLPDYSEDSGFLTMDQRSLTWADVDNDGDLDLLHPSVFAGFGLGPTVLLRNDGPGNGNAWTFTDTGQPLPVTGSVATAWADMDADGDVDLMFANMGGFEPPTLDLYRNDGGTLVRADTALAAINVGTADWGDADGDGDFDLVVAGNLIRPDETGETVVRILFKDPGGWTPVDVVHEFQSPEEPWLDFDGVTWADYDSDGDVDLLITGQQLGVGELVGRSEVYANNGGVFTLAGAPISAPNFGNTGGAYTWFDIDGDGDLDYFVAGGYYMPGGNGLIESRGQLYRNDAPGSNAAPSAPTSLKAVVAGDVALSWNASTDDGTPTASLSYELEVTRLGAGPSEARLLAGPVALVLPQPGNVSDNTAWTLHGLAPGDYEWTVRALDNAFNGSPLGHGSFTLGTTSVVTTPGPRELDLSPAVPNPSAGESRFALTLERRQRVSIFVYDVAGHRVASLHDGPLGAGSHTFTLHGEDMRCGLYFIHARGESGSTTQRLTLFR